MKKTFIIRLSKPLLHFRTSGLILAGLAWLTASPTFAIMLVDRGLPTENLNDTTGNRSNVAWANPQAVPPDPNNYSLAGDSFQNTSVDTWDISQITVWTVGSTLTAELIGGVQGSSNFGMVGSSPSITSVTYADGSTYQIPGTSSYLNLYQVDFAVNILLAPGQTYDFFLNGTTLNTSTYAPFVHASNAALSGSPQEGADGSMLYGDVVNGTFDPSTIGTWTSAPPNGPWDQASDLNVQVFGTSIPEVTYTALLLGLGFLTLVAFGHKQNHQAAAK